ncbi:hypothetical protein HGRIS_004394 [Hohenbuehelia grisea]|uniref:Uncharacterized protein n=1 Tax=Hohenbuehelia grisea TaxID=104357 RepID=A0ABR3JDD9_9AGAR
MEEQHLTWANVSLAFSFIVFDALISVSFGLGVSSALLTAAIRCVVQLSLVALLLQKVFDSGNLWAVIGISCLLNILGTFETVVIKANRRHRYMFATTLTAMLVANVPVSIIGTRYAMAVDPFWEPAQFIPIIGMLCGNAVSGIVVSVDYLLKELGDTQDKVEMYLGFGATRMEACRPLARDALKLALTPAVNRMSVLGIIAIPGMMTGAILGGASVERAARLQMIIIFMITAATALAALVSTVFALGIVVDGEHRVRTDRIDTREHVVWRARDKAAGWVVEQVSEAARWMAHAICCARHSKDGDIEERTALLE